MPEFINKKFITSSEMCDNILKETGVALLPGSDFGFVKTKMLVRLSFTDFNGQEFMTKTKDKKKIDNNLILKLAPKIAEGVDKLNKWSDTI
jgi:aspartate aminotransferase